MYTESLKNILLSQSDIAILVETAQSTVSRFISNKMPPANIAIEVSEKRRKYDFAFTRQVITELFSKHLIPQKKVQVFFNFKGGTGKTSMCHQIAVMFALYGFKVLAIDCDPQAHLSHSLGFEEYQDNKTLYDVIVNAVDINETVLPVYPGLDAIPANLSLTRLEVPLNQMTNREKVLMRKLEPLKDKYDFIFIDTNPTISTLNRNATLAADMLNIVCETQPYSLKGLEMLLDEIHTLAHAMEKDIEYQIIPNKYEAKTATSQEVLGALHTRYKGKVLEVIVRRCEDMNISAKKRTPLFAFCNTKSIAREDIIDLTKAMIANSTVENKRGTLDAA